ncbi:MAG TPA: HepT-like ribonuclease domain-containing protein [Chloroflexota bacterium]|nr:HepT-like ribonuclease domain-containing protein [Chloroflexota bacterium]
MAQYTRGGRAAFVGEPMVQDAVPRRLETLADAAQRLSDPLKARHPEIRWRAIYGFRNIAAHAYRELQLDPVGEIVEVHPPILKEAVEEELGRAP